MLKSSSYFPDDILLLLHILCLSRANMPFEGLCIVYRNEFLVRLAIAVHKVRLSGDKPLCTVFALCIED